MQLQKALTTDCAAVYDFYTDAIEDAESRSDSVGWKKGVYPSNEFLREAIEKGELWMLAENGQAAACAVLHSRGGDIFADLPLASSCKAEEALYVNTLAVHPSMRGRGRGKELVRQILALAAEEEKRCVRLDLLARNHIAEALYTGMGFCFVGEKKLYYEDTGLADFRMFEYTL